jgi:Amt family ammonium transporter
MVGVLVSNELGIFSGMGLAEGKTISSQLMVQITGVVAVGAYTAIVTYVLLKIIDRITGLRVTAEEETSGLDVEYPNERGYDL